MDSIDLQILELLTQNSRMKVKDMAEQIHMTAPAITSRIQKLEDQGIITGYTTQIDRVKIGYPVHVFITVTMKVQTHTPYLDYVASFSPQIAQHHRIAGSGCYLIEAHFASNQDLSNFLDELENFASYQVASSVNQVI
ncbi:TPA: Lrp/AsnC family transcriptional regulator [Streptococcus suis]|uniref:Lrp/AsnC family transcriptional regulator n=1 Tax=Streptococcus TaxID=1301 RepID=UPI0019619041|nr:MULTISPECIES: Lrp/AsnC family transcriptional regulator [Streptococcus]MBM7134887.1 Lrp/AsnC family transcriptional regulator [Streptococcus suis]MBO3641746.1 Lrp/AsnC family transcriptional regulator [Streptococcus suis]MBY0730375.1 Lrp/AsnC family transcriptional regulator [Streptococcus sp. 2018162]MCO8176008.1 Lrp/AsnC family transcriptional regulator [Streptococcus suis]HEM3462967.1 Lrp/AsnC family transcriptional regulator [Streptococcus suis]